MEELNSNTRYKIVYVTSRCGYGQFDKFLKGKIIRKVGNESVGYWHEFEDDEVRHKFNVLNKFGNNKSKYLFDACLVQDLETRRLVLIPKVVED